MNGTFFSVHLLPWRLLLPIDTGGHATDPPRRSAGGAAAATVGAPVLAPPTEPHPLFSSSETLFTAFGAN